jgi:hypothetical protein
MKTQIDNKQSIQTSLDKLRNLLTISKGFNKKLIKDRILTLELCLGDLK